MHVEPTDDSMDKAAGYARRQGPWDGFVAVGGGSSIDTAKAVNLMTTDGGELMDYINKPIGGAAAPARQLKPLIAVPTTAGTGSESTAMCVLDILSMKVKTGISHWRLRPTLAVIDPLLTLTFPPRSPRRPGWTSCATRWSPTPPAGTPRSTASSPSSASPTAAPTRSPTCGASRRCGCWPPRSAPPSGTATDLEARSNMMLAATFAGMGFGNSGVHIPHANAYPIAGMVKEYQPPNYPQPSRWCRTACRCR